METFLNTAFTRIVLVAVYFDKVSYFWCDSSMILVGFLDFFKPQALRIPQNYRSPVQSTVTFINQHHTPKKYRPPCPTRNLCGIKAIICEYSYALAILNWPRFFPSPILFLIDLAYIEICRSVYTELTNF